jgi:formylmethanofuran dehydrogenase subunit E
MSAHTSSRGYHRVEANLVIVIVGITVRAYECADSTVGVINGCAVGKRVLSTVEAGNCSAAEER